jgi:hypothetical protein
MPEPEAIEAITRAEVANMMAAAGLADIAQDDKLLEYLTGTINRAAIEANPALYETLRKQLTGKASEATLDAARNIAKREAETWAQNLAKAEINKMGKVIAHGIEQGWHPTETARHLNMVKGLDGQRAGRMLDYAEYLDGLDIPKKEWERRYESRFQKELRDRKRVIAQTEQRFATSEGHQLKAEALGLQYKAWMTTGDGRVSDECQSNEAQGWIGIDKSFDAGAKHPPQHPRCRCTLSYRRAKGKAADQRAEDRASATAAAKEAGAGA